MAFTLPRFEKKVRVALDWALDLLFSKDPVQFIDVNPGKRDQVKVTEETSESSESSASVPAT